MKKPLYEAFFVEVSMGLYILYIITINSVNTAKIVYNQDFILYICQKAKIQCLH